MLIMEAFSRLRLERVGFHRGQTTRLGPPTVSIVGPQSHGLPNFCVVNQNTEFIHSTIGFLKK